MADRPILFSGPMVSAILTGTKAQTRRAAKPRRNSLLLDGLWSDDYVLDPGNRAALLDESPYGQPGDSLWVRETWAYGIHAMAASRDEDGPFVYAADGTTQGRLCDRWRPSIHMPRAASRITLEITGVRVERLLDISEADCWAEGIAETDGTFTNVEHIDMARRLGCCIDDAKPGYALLWESINGPGSWDANPWVWVVEFKRVADGVPLHKNDQGGKL